MEIKISDIPEGGLQVELHQKAEELGPLGDDVAAPDGAKALFSLSKTGPVVHLSGTVDTRLQLVCSRCGKAYSAGSSSRLSLELNPMESLAEEPEKELLADELEVEFYRDGVVDLSDVLREQVVLQVPMKPLCREDCRGLCQYCGQDRNDGDCGCEPQIGHIGLAGLKGLLEDEGDK